MNEKYINVVEMPDLTIYRGVRVEENTILHFKNKYVNQNLKNLVFTSKNTIVEKRFKSVTSTEINLNVGDVIIFEGEKRGYIVPVEKFITVDEAIKEYEPLKEM